RALTELKALHPDLDIRFIAEDSDVLMNGIQDGTLDLALLDSWYGSPLHIPAGVTSQFLYHDVVDIALPNDHPLAGRTQLSLDELADIAWVVWRQGQTFT